MHLTATECEQQQNRVFLLFSAPPLSLLPRPPQFVCTEHLWDTGGHVVYQHRPDKTGTVAAATEERRRLESGVC